MEQKLPRLLYSLFVYILYLDESGTTPESSYFVVAGLAVFEREIYWFSQELDNLQQQYFPGTTAPILFHATKLRVREGEKVEEPWNSLSDEKRRELRERIYSILRNRRGILFGCAIEKRLAHARSEDPYERAFEDLVSRFDLFLSRLNRQMTAEGRDEQRGLIVLAESSYQKTIALLARRLSEQGTRWGLLHNVCDVPLFAPAKDTRLLQYADFCANAIYGRYHAKLTGDFDSIAPRFDQDSGVIHGLSHLSTDAACACIACFSRRSRQVTFPPA
ncbi:MAG: DUF3800 domain-containing protein [Chloroflexota bacterium]